jgi:threonine dehydratase
VTRAASSHGAAPALSAAAIERAAAGIDAAFVRTPVVRHDDVDAWLGARVACKVETLGPIRSFKGRGADWYVRTRGESGVDARAPLLCASAGNFGQGLAWAARTAGLPCTVFAATTANALKVARMRALGATVVQAGDDFDAAKDAARAHGAAHGIPFVEDGREPAIAVGAGTIALELCAQGGAPETLLVPLGNGALLAGVATWIRAVSPATRIVAVVASGAPAMRDSLRAGTLVRTAHVATIADGIAVREPVPEALAMLSGCWDDVVAVDDDALVAAMRGLARHAGLVVEPAGAAGIAALLAAPHGTYGARVATILCGGNVAEERIADWIGAA